MVDHGSNRALQALEQLLDIERTDTNHRFAGFNLGEVQQVVDQGREPLGGLADEIDLFFLLGRQLAVTPSEQKAGQALDRVERRAQLVAHFGEEAGFEVGQALESLGVLVELGVQRHDAPVGLVKLAIVHLGDLRLTIAQLLKCVEQLLILLLELFQKSLGGVRARSAEIRPSSIGVRAVARYGQTLGHRNRGAASLIGFGREFIHQPLGAGGSGARTPRRAVLAIDDRLKVLDTRTPFADPNQEGRRGPDLTLNSTRPATRVPKCIPGDLRGGRGDASLVELGKTQQPRELARPLSSEHDVELETHFQGHEGHVHARSDLPSSCRQRRSRRHGRVLWSR